MYGFHKCLFVPQVVSGSHSPRPYTVKKGTVVSGSIDRSPEDEPLAIVIDERVRLGDRLLVSGLRVDRFPDHKR